MRYPVVLFDVGETLIGPRISFGATYSAELRRHGVELDAARLDAALRRTARAIESEIPPGVDRYRLQPGGERAYWQRFSARVLADALGREEPELANAALDGLREAFRRVESWRVYDDSRPTLEALRAAGCRLGVVSNWDSRLIEVLKLLELDAYFETIAVSHLEGIEKPDPRIFERALERMEAEPAQALHIGDRPDMDLEGARRAGVDAVVIDRSGRFPDARPRIERLEPIVGWARTGLP